MQSTVRSVAFVGLSGLSLWLLSAAPADALGQRSDLHGVIVDAASVQRFGAATPAGTGSIDERQCSFRGIELAGKVKVVESFPDIRVKAVSSFPDIKVKKVDGFADDCGEWQFVESFPDFTIQYVDSFPDVELAWVESFPGLP